jgi:monoamine oxidase
MSAKSRDVDVAVVGAGAAGIACGRALARARGSVQILEAAERLGGRADTATHALGVPFDRGAAWLHCASRNPLRAHADALGLRYAGDPAMRYHVDGRWLDPSEAKAVDSDWRAANTALREAGERGVDIAAAEVLDPNARHAAVRDYLLTAIRAVPPSHYATADAAAEVDTHEDWVMLDGLGTLVARLGVGLPVATATPVRRIAHEASGVRVDTDAGALRAGAAVVTVSAGVLAAGDIAFDPPLSDAKRAALQAVPMGRAEKIVLHFTGDPFGAGPNTYVTIERGGEAMGFHLLPAGEGWLAIGYAGGAQAEAVAGESGLEWAIGYLEHAFGTDVRRRLLANTHTDWTRDPLTRGAYSAARPGGANAGRASLAAAHGERVLFAGEATQADAFASVHGAWASGERAAEAALAALGHRRAPPRA